MAGWRSGFLRVWRLRCCGFWGFGLWVWGFELSDDIRLWSWGLGFQLFFLECSFFFLGGGGEVESMLPMSCIGVSWIFLCGMRGKGMDSICLLCVCLIFTVQYAVSHVLYILYYVLYTVYYIISYTLYNVYCKLYNLYCAILYCLSRGAW